MEMGLLCCAIGGAQAVFVGTGYFITRREQFMQIVIVYLFGGKLVGCGVCVTCVTLFVNMCVCVCVLICVHFFFV